jgi:hypothetical protein
MFILYWLQGNYAMWCQAEFVGVLYVVKIVYIRELSEIYIIR